MPPGLNPFGTSLVALFLGLHCSSVACDEKLGGAWNEATSLEDLNLLGMSYSSRGLDPWVPVGTSPTAEDIPNLDICPCCFE